MSMEIIRVGDQAHEVEVRPLTVVAKSPEVYEELVYDNRLPIYDETTLFHMARVEKLHRQFPKYWRTMFDNDDGHGVMPVPVPTPENIRTLDTGLRHLGGLIDLFLKFRDMGVPVVLIRPETHLHPRMQCRLAELLCVWAEETES